MRFRGREGDRGKTGAKNLKVLEFAGNDAALREIGRWYMWSVVHVVSGAFCAEGRRTPRDDVLLQAFGGPMSIATRRAEYR